MNTLENLLKESVAFHGHMCPGQVLGVRLAMVGCEAVGIPDPQDTKELIVYVEIDRCASDAIQTVTGCKLGKRSLKFVDYGKLAATFINTRSHRAIRVVAREDSRDRAYDYVPSAMSKEEAQLKAYMVMPEEELFTLQEVAVELTESDIPGKPKGRVLCQRCGEGVNDGRWEKVNGHVYCRPCANGGYYRLSIADTPQRTR